MTAASPSMFKKASGGLFKIGVKMNVLASEADAQGIHITVSSGSEGTGPPPRSHDWAESFYVNAGQVQFSCDGTHHELLGRHVCTYSRRRRP